MKKIFYFLSFLVTVYSYSQEVKDKIVEASCGQCQFGMTSKKGCDLAVKIDGKSYFVTQTKIDQHGDAHAEDGFCNAIRKAKVTGTIKEEVFEVASFELLPAKKD